MVSTFEISRRKQSNYNMVVVKAIGIISLILANLGNVLLLGVIHFEKYGQDPMKRSFPDRLFSACCWLQIYISFFSNLIANCRSLIGNKKLYELFSYIALISKSLNLQDQLEKQLHSYSFSIETSPWQHFLCQYAKAYCISAFWFSNGRNVQLWMMTFGVPIWAWWT